MSLIYARSGSPLLEMAGMAEEAPPPMLLSSSELAARIVQPYCEGPFYSQSGQDRTMPVQATSDLTKENISAKARSKRGSETLPV
ncbi:hypothetical protein AXF42_Ash003747 [Apostasia shenzhenica]|uniref:Uncharacterized protein n=1 Tax=Apostasia shenzhenica TaxID=1088818 RepID=A0A2I0AHU2_9ASPA|nr:hypothetical protein AXF42_Ash003747 [Apostasia shenzhenica]